MRKRILILVTVFLMVLSYPLAVMAAETRPIQSKDLKQMKHAQPGVERPNTDVKIAPKPDLVIMDMKIFPVNPKTNDTVHFTAKVHNKGQAAAAASQAAIRIGGESNPPLIPVPVLSPNAIKIISRDQTMTQAGRFKAMFIADAQSNVNESNEKNNTRQIDFRVNEVLPDLTLVDAIVKPANPTTKDQIFLQATIKNIGQTTAGKFATGVRIGGESQPKVVGTVGHLDVTTPQSQKYVVARLWNTSRPGKYIIDFYVDVKNEVKERNEQNNTLRFTITVTP